MALLLLPSSASSSIARRRIGSEKASKNSLACSLSHAKAGRPLFSIFNVNWFAELHYPAILFLLVVPSNRAKQPADAMGSIAAEQLMKMRSNETVILLYISF
jgi:hypothetical protein